ncbi:unnamed protein product [Staurois parvus]|uniref:Uncharacterized protein n=1 Tax=Staurois parvus TaxID=386267 RepID=A0ABN9BVM7_9NEOB|nr:unnamed protein product [Staurois parvus]
MFPVKKSLSFVNLDIHKENSKLNHITSGQRQTNSLGAFGDESVIRRRKEFASLDYPSLALRFPLHMKRTDSSSSLTEKEHIQSLDLSANDLENIDLINKKSLLANHLERLEKIELQQNRLTSLPKSLCEEVAAYHI